jgi:hypothetical protein
MAGIKSVLDAAITICGIELAHRIRKRQFSFGPGTWPGSWSLKRVWERALSQRPNILHSRRLCAIIRQCTRTQTMRRILPRPSNVGSSKFSLSFYSPIGRGRIELRPPSPRYLPSLL